MPAGGRAGHGIYMSDTGYACKGAWGFMDFRAGRNLVRVPGRQPRWSHSPCLSGCLRTRGLTRYQVTIFLFWKVMDTVHVRSRRVFVGEFNPGPCEGPLIWDTNQQMWSKALQQPCVRRQAKVRKFSCSSLNGGQCNCARLPSPSSGSRFTPLWKGG